MTRLERIELLISSREDYLPLPKGALRTLPGLAANARRACPECGHLEHPGWIRRGEVPCVTCGGRTQGRLKPGTGWIPVDRMDSESRPIRTVETRDLPGRPPVTVMCDACGGEGVGGAHLDDEGREYRDRCERCGGSGRRSVTPLSPDPVDVAARASDPVTAKLERRARLGSYRELDAALGWLRAYAPRGYRALLEERRGPVRDRALRLVSGRMPARIRVPREVVEAAKLERQRAAGRPQPVGKGAGVVALEKRNGQMVRLVDQGKPAQWVADQYGVSVATVNRAHRAAVARRRSAA